MAEELLHDQSNLNRLRTLTSVLERTETELATSERRYRNFVQNSSEGIWRYELERGVPVSYDPDKQIDMIYEYAYLAEANDTMAKQYGHDSGEELIGARLAETLPDDPPSREYLKKWIENGYSLSHEESQEIDKDGVKKVFLNSLQGEVVDGRLLRAWGTQVDITDRVALEHQLAYQIELYEAIMENVMDIIKIQDTEGVIQYASPSHLDALQYTPAELVGHNVREFVHPEDFHIMDDVLKLAVSGGVSEIVSFRMKRKDGRWIRIEGMARGIHEGDKITTVLSIAWRSRLRQFRQQMNNEENGHE